MIGRRADVFISYRQRSRHAVWTHDTLVPALEAEGFRVLIDVRDFTPGAVLVDSMEQASAAARVTVAIIDETYAAGGFVGFERHIASRLIAVRRDHVDATVAAEAAITVDAVGTEDPAAVVEAVQRLVRRVFVLEAPEDEEWVDGVLIPTLDRTGASVESAGDIEPGSFFVDAVIEKVSRADRVVLVLSRAYLRDIHPRAGRLVSHLEAEENRDIVLPLRREADLEVPLALRSREIIDASRAELWDEALARVCEAVGVELPPPEHTPPCPYPGMRPFTEGEGEQFFGRDDEIDAVLAGLRRRRFSAVIGPSASGKSSLAIAGVAPRVGRHGPGGGEPWRVELIRPGSLPRDALERALERWRSGPRQPLLVIIDQLEEVFAPDGTAQAPDGTAQAPDGTAQAEAFQVDIERLVANEPDVHVLVTLRADFYPSVMSGPLWPLISASRVEVVPLSGTALREAIRAPARRRGVVVEEALVERLAAETEGQPGLLPFLQETLVTLWAALHHRLMTLASYERLGGGEGTGVLQSIRREAESAVGEITADHPDGEKVVRSILVRLVQFGEGRPHTRRQLPVDALRSAAPDEATFRAIFATLVARRLLTVQAEPKQAEKADLSHEAIIRGWPDLARWIKERQATEATRRRLLADAKQWEDRVASGHPDVGLLQSIDLAEAQRWTSSPDAAELGLDPAIVRFVDASAKRERRRRRRRVVTVVTAITALAVVAVVLAVSTLVARRAQRDAEQASQERLALQLRAASAEFGEDRLPLRALLVRAADQFDPSPLSMVEMLATGERERPIAARIDRPPGQVSFDGLWVDDEVLVVGAEDGSVSVWPMAGGLPDTSSVRTVDVGHTPLAMSRQPGGDLLAIGGGDGSPEDARFSGRDGGLHLVDLASSAPSPREIPLGGDSPVSALDWLDGATLIAGRWDGTVTVIDVSDPAAPVNGRAFDIPSPPDGAPAVCRQPVRAGDRKVRAVAMDPAGRWLAAGANNCLIVVWDLRSPGTPGQVLLGHEDKVRTLVFVPASATTLLSSGDDRSVRTWEVSETTGPSTLQASSADAQRVISLCVAPDGSALVTAGRDHVVRRWELNGSTLTPGPTALRGHGQTIRAVACPTPSTFASLGADGLVLWDLNRPSRVGRAVPLADLGLSSVEAVAVRPGGGGEVAVAATGGRGEVLLRGPAGQERTLALGGTYPLAVSYSPDGAFLAVAGDTAVAAPGGSVLEGRASVYEASGLTEVARSATGSQLSFRAVAVLDADEWVVGSDDGSIEVHDGGDVRRGRTVSGFGVRSLAYTPGGQVLVGDEAGNLLCFDRAGMDRPLGQLLLGRTIGGIAVGGDGTVAAATGDGFVAVFPGALRAGAGACDPGSWLRVDLTVSSAAATSVSLTAGGDLLVVGTVDGTVELWDVSRRRRLGVLVEGGAGERAYGAVDPAGSTIVAGAGDGADVYLLERTSLRQRLCDLARRDVTPDEIATFLPERDQQEAARCGSDASS